MQRTRQKIMASLTKKGFIQNDYKDHFFFTYHTKSGKKTNIFTKLSRGTHHKTIGDSLLNPMAKQCKLDKNDFIDLIDCPLSRDDYENRLINNNHI